MFRNQTQTPPLHFFFFETFIKNYLKWHLAKFVPANNFAVSLKKKKKKKKFTFLKDIINSKKQNKREDRSTEMYIPECPISEPDMVYIKK
jgi:hypothetical protein